MAIIRLSTNYKIPNSRQKNYIFKMGYIMTADFSHKNSLNRQIDR